MMIGKHLKHMKIIPNELFHRGKPLVFAGCLDFRKHNPQTQKMLIMLTGMRVQRFLFKTNGVDPSRGCVNGLNGP